MRSLSTLARPSSVPIVLAAGVLAFATPVCAQDYTYGIEISGVLCGYVDRHVSPAGAEGKPYIQVTERVFVLLSALGSEFNTEVAMTWHLDPGTHRITYHDAKVRQGDTELAMRVHVEGNAIHFVYPLDDEEKTLTLDDGVILENPLSAPHLVRDFVEHGVASAEYPILDLREAEVQPVCYTRVEQETLELRGERFDTLVLDRENKVTSLKIRQWIDKRSGMVVKMDIPGDRLIYLAEPSVRDRIELANLDSTIACKVNVAIADIHAISFMKVRALLEPTGLRPTVEGLNVPGQKFEGTVEGNRIEGVFTIEHPLYRGAGAPPLPTDFTGEEDLAPFLAPEDLIESDDPILIEHARRVTEGAKDSWDAACRLSRWVADNVDYAIPGSGGARKTFDARAGECGAHSLLLAGLCRASGIPARVVWGCMYIPNFGGAFGQHAWTEVYMGDAGWIPVDCTAHENDFVDSGHIRVGVYQSFSTAINMKEMEVLEHRLRGTATEPPADAMTRLRPYVGLYDRPGADGEPFEVLVKEGGLAVDIPGQVVLGLREPDDHGRWYAVLTNRVYCTFPRDGDGDVAALVIHEIVRMQRRADPDAFPETVPAEVRPYLGTYRFAAIRADFEVLWDEGGLGVHDPNEDKVVHLEPTGEPGVWIDEFDKNTLSFERQDGEVTALLLDAANRFERRGQDPESKPLDTEARVRAMLTDWHDAGAEANGERFFGHLASDVVLFGTDPGERWSKEEFERAFEPYLARGEGPNTRAVEQHVYLSADETFAWFEERLLSAKFGELRGTGVARLNDGRWQIVQYNTSLPVPNELFLDVVEMRRRLKR